MGSCSLAMRFVHSCVSRAHQFSLLLSISLCGVSLSLCRGAAGQRFHEELARQLAGFSVRQLAASPGNMITLPDLYCVFNRARGTELISPDDLVRACSLFERLGLQVRMRRFPSGVMVVQSAVESDEHLSEQLCVYIRKHVCQSALQVSLGLGMAVSLAREQLLVGGVLPPSVLDARSRACALSLSRPLSLASSLSHPLTLSSFSLLYAHRLVPLACLPPCRLRSAWAISVVMSPSVDWCSTPTTFLRSTSSAVVEAYRKIHAVAVHVPRSCFC
jgi:EAP30/Vps36 family